MIIMYSLLCDAVTRISLSPPTDTGFGTIYVSDDRGTVYSKSLERHLYTTTGGETDFTNVTSLRGVFITSVLAEGRAGPQRAALTPPTLMFPSENTHMYDFSITCRRPDAG